MYVHVKSVHAKTLLETCEVLGPQEIEIRPEIGMIEIQILDNLVA